MAVLVRVGIAVLALACASLPVLAQEEVPLQGEAFLGEEGCPDGLKSKSCILSIRIEGKAAQLLYDGMQGKAQSEECTGGLEKTDGNGLFCNLGTDKDYQCYFGYHFKQKKFGGGAFSC